MVKKLIFFYVLVFVAIGVNYYTPPLVAAVFFAGTLIAYLRSEDEAFWLAFYLIMSEGIFSLLGKNEILLTVIPGLPAVEVAQLYILITVFKAFRSQQTFRPFYSGYLIALTVYLVFLIVQGIVLGLDLKMNIAFRVIKLLLPLLLFFSIPRLLSKESGYESFFTYIFPVVFFALGTQVFSMAVGKTPAGLLGFEEDARDVRVSENYPYRGFFSVKIVLISLFGALYLIARKNRSFPSIYLYMVLAGCFLVAFFSATRGWILGFGLAIFLFFTFILKLDPRRLAMTGFAFLLILGISMYFPIMEVQINSAFNRVLSLGALAEGDITAGGTLVRLSTRSPRVMHKWEESPLTGWGFSDMYFEYADGHVANQNILLHSGIIGLLLLLGFFIHFHSRLLLRSYVLPPGHIKRDALLVFVFFFMGWFLIHSTSGQHFGFYLDPSGGMIQSVFFSMGAMALEQPESLTIQKQE